MVGLIMNELRKRFEEMGFVIVKPHMMVFNEQSNRYFATDDCFRLQTSFVNGAWFMFRELNK